MIVSKTHRCRFCRSHLASEWVLTTHTKIFFVHLSDSKYNNGLKMYNSQHISS